MIPPPSLRFQGSARIENSLVFGPVDITIATGAWTCLLGQSGVGKSTILRLLAGIAPAVAFEGSITLSDSLPAQGRVALMAQDDLLLPWLSALDNVLLGARLRGEAADPARAESVLQRVGLGAHLHKPPEALSGGERQRVALARTLMEDRPIVFLDEPFSALDARTRTEMQDLAYELLRGKTVLMVTHDPAEAIRLGDHVLLLTRESCTPLALPKSTPPRAVDDPEALSAQGALLARLMERP